MKKKEQEIINLYNKYGLKLLENFKNVDTKLDCVDSFGYKYSITPYNLSKRKSLNMESGALNGKNPFKEYNINLYMRKRGLGCDILNIPTHIDTEFCLFRCRICGKKFCQLFKIFKQSEHKCCPNCLKKEKKKKNRGILYIENIFSKSGYKLLEFQDKGMHHSYYIEDNLGYKGRMLPYTAKKKDSKIEKFHAKNIYSIDNINLYLTRNNINLKCIESDCFGTYKPLHFKCPCGETFLCIWDNVKKGKWKCNRCSRSMSNNEYKAKVFLDYLEVDYIGQYNIGKNGEYDNLFLDFYIPSIKLAIEINGEQHYTPVCFGGMSQDDANKKFEIQKDKDNTKRLYCKNNNIELLEISYVDIKNNRYKDILSTKINDLRK